MTSLGAITYSHQGLATTTLVLTALTTVTGVILLGSRYGKPPRNWGQTAVRWAHIVLGICMAGYMIATYVLVPI